MNITDFIDSIKMQLSDLINVGAHRSETERVYAIIYTS